MEVIDFDVDAMARESNGNPNIEGPYRQPDGQWMFDRRYTMKYIVRMGARHHIAADFGLRGPDRIPLSKELATELGLT